MVRKCDNVSRVKAPPALGSTLFVDLLTRALRETLCGDLLALARHTNYGRYTVMREGYAFAIGGWLWSALISRSSTILRVEACRSWMSIVRRR